MIRYPEQRVGVFIDVQNMYYSARAIHQRKVNFGAIVTEGVGDRKLIRALAYVVRTKTGEETQFIEALQKQGIETREKDIVEYLSGQKKADWDVGMTIDVVQMLDTLDVVILVSGDGDFVPLVHYVQSRGRQVEVMSFRESTSGKLVEAANDHTDFSSQKRKFLMGPAPRGPSVRRGESAASGGSFMTPNVQKENASDDDDRRHRTLSF